MYTHQSTGNMQPVHEESGLIYDRSPHVQAVGPLQLDWLAFLLVVLLAGLLCYGTAESSYFNNGVFALPFFDIASTCLMSLTLGRAQSCRQAVDDYMLIDL